MRRPLIGLVAFAWLTTPAAAQAPGANCRNTDSFERWLDAFKQEAAAQGISPHAMAAAAPYLTLDPDIIRRDRGQRFFAQSFLDFSSKMLPAYRMQRGAQLIRTHADIFSRIEKQYGVPPAVIVGFWGLESDFGASHNKLSVLRSIATLAYDCRRSAMFRAHLFDALRLIERGDLTPDEMIGSWAGELGQTQMMPSEYFKHAVDYDGDRRRDLMHSVPDVLASTANYLASLGWRRGEPWLQEVRVPANLPWDQADLAIQHPRAQWIKWGVTAADGRALPSDDLKASLLLPMGRLGPAFLAYENFQAYLKWNSSLVYATTAAYYATRLAGAPALSRGQGNIPVLSVEQVKDLQQILQQQGHDVGNIDGRIGMATRAAVKKTQIKLGLPADSYPTPELLQRLRRGS